MPSDFERHCHATWALHQRDKERRQAMDLLDLLEDILRWRGRPELKDKVEFASQEYTRITGKELEEYT